MKPKPFFLLVFFLGLGLSGFGCWGPDRTQRIDAKQVDLKNAQPPKPAPPPTTPPPAETPPTATAPTPPPAPKTPSKEELLLQESAKSLAGELCIRLSGCGTQWESEDNCADSMGKDISSLLESKMGKWRAKEIEKCREAIKKSSCSLISAYKFPQECSMIR